MGELKGRRNVDLEISRGRSKLFERKKRVDVGQTATYYSRGRGTSMMTAACLTPRCDDGVDRARAYPAVHLLAPFVNSHRGVCSFGTWKLKPYNHW